MAKLAAELRTLDYFSLGFGTMVGVGWLVVMDDWLARGGPLGAMLGFALGGALLVPVAYVYGRLVMAIPDAGSEIAYTQKVFPPSVSFGTGWMMFLAYFIVCPWECVAVGKIAAYLVPGLNSCELYRVGGRPVYLPQLAVGVALALVITAVNFRGIRWSATLQNWATFGLLALFAIFVAFGVARGSAANFAPGFSHRGWVSVLLVLQVVPYFMTGFESVPKSSEEAVPEFNSQGFFRAILWALGVGVLFYVSVIAVVAFVHPWPVLAHASFATAVAFDAAFRRRWIVNLIFGAALVSLVKIFNGNFVASSRLAFALGRTKLIPSGLGAVHARHQTPSAAVVCVGALTVAATFFGEAILVPVTEVGSMASAAGWLAACAAYFRMEARGRERALAAAGAAVALAMILMKLLPIVPGHFTGAEFVALAIWAAGGFALHRVAKTGR